MFIADLHIHSKYARATSQECVPEHLARWAKRKGIDVLGTGDFTHPIWRQELKTKLIPSAQGFYQLKAEYNLDPQVAGEIAQPHFVISGEISSIYKKNGKVRKVHNLILLPSLEAADKLAGHLEQIGNIHSDGRPILGLDSRDLLEITLESCPEAIFIPAHIWTPHFSLFGAYSGFDSIQECFEDLTPYIHALETGLSSDPAMNWRISALDSYNLISNSDAHSPGNLGREANLFDTDISYPGLAGALNSPSGSGFCGTIEFFPEEGKYHNDGHRNCKVCMKPSQTIRASGLCPVCGKPVTLGVLHRVEALADRPEGFKPSKAKPFESLVPLAEVIGAAVKTSANSKKVRQQYDALLQNLGPEFYILRQAPLEDIKNQAGVFISEAIRKLRAGQVEVYPGYDGEYGKVKIFSQTEMDKLAGQISLFTVLETATPQPVSTKDHHPLPLPILTEENLQDTKPDTAENHYGLNDLQWQAVTTQEQALAVLAGPGTGKTKTLVYRIAHLIENCGVPPSHITAVTFTNKAAREMKERLTAYFKDKRTVRAMTIGTFHSICLQLLNRWQPGYSILDQYSAQGLAAEIIAPFGLAISPSSFLQALSAWKNGSPLSENIPLEACQAYQQMLSQYQTRDYDDILLHTLEQYDSQSLKDKKALAAFQHLLVDEFQDINQIQYQLIQKWGANSASIFVIGDPDQAIYGFRGSDSQCFTRFAQDFAPTQAINLVQNYRSAPEIIRCALPVISGGQNQNHCLEPQKADGGQVRLLEVEDNFAEAIFIAKEINRLMGGIDMLDAGQAMGQGQNHSFADFAILYRTHRQAEILEQCLQKESIPYRVCGREDFLATPQVRQALGFFRYLLNPKDLLALSVLLRDTGLHPGKRQDILKAYKEQPTPDHLISLLANSGQQGQGLSKNFELLAPKIKKDKPAKLLQLWVEQNLFGGVLELEKLINSAFNHKDMADFLHNIALGAENDLERQGSKKYNADAVSLLTLHGAKGLEFPVVFLCGVRDGLIPFRSHHKPCDLAEERRLFYVGVTRAQDKLLLLTDSNSSPFLANLEGVVIPKEKALPNRKRQMGTQLSLFK